MAKRKTFDLTKGREEAEKNRAESEAKARSDWKALTDKDEWPDEEHEGRFNALVRICLFTKNSRMR